MTDKNKQTKVTLLIPTELWEKVKSLADKEHRPNNGQAVWLLEKSIEMLEKKDT